MSVHCPKISVITPSLNQGRSIEKSILSVLNQDYPNLEYIIIDGGSTDASVEIIKKYEKCLAFWVSESDRGYMNAINKGLPRATGEIIAWLNTDDFYYPGVFIKAAEEFSKDTSIDLLYGDAVLVSEKGRPLFKQTPKGINLRLLSIDCYLAQPSTFIKKDLIKKVGGFDQSITIGADYDFWIRAFKNGKVKYLPLLISKITISYNTKSFKNWGQTIKDNLTVQAKYFHSPSLKMYIMSAAYASSKYIPFLSDKKITLKSYSLGIIRYIRYNILSPLTVLRHISAILNLLYLRLVRGIWTWKKIRQS